eukprot:scaffold6362_cov378-Prasinococcus_capsulatus_cf.AAC.4
MGGGIYRPPKGETHTVRGLLQSTACPQPRSESPTHPPDSPRRSQNGLAGVVGGNMPPASGRLSAAVSDSALRASRRTHEHVPPPAVQ